MTEEYKRPRGRPKKKENVSMSEFARMCGFNPRDISNYTGGVEPRVIVEDRKIDIRNPTNKKFLQDYQLKKEKKALLDEANTEARITIAEVMKKEADAKWKAIKARKETKELIDVRVVEKVFLMVGRTIRELLLPQGERVSPKVCAEFGNVERDMMLKVQNIVDDENEKALEEIINTLKTAVEEEEFFECFDDKDFL